MNPSEEDSLGESQENFQKTVISYSRNVFLPVTNICRNNCSYCSFRRESEDGAWFLSEEEALDLAGKGKESDCSEALITLGERPETQEKAKKRLEEMGHEDTVEYLESLCKKVLELGLLPHTNAGLLNEEELQRLKRYNASMGLMLECAAEVSAHRESPGKDPEIRLEMIESAGKLQIPFTTGILVGIGENWRDRVQSLLEIRKLQEKYGHIQEVIIQPFTPKSGTPMENASPPTHSEILSTLVTAKNVMPDMNIQIPPNLTSEFSDFLHLGVNDFGGISSVTPDFINPENPWPEIAELKSKVNKAGCEIRERLPIYPKFTRKPDFMSEEIEPVVEELSGKNGYRDSTLGKT